MTATQQRKWSNLTFNTGVGFGRREGLHPILLPMDIQRGGFLPQGHPQGKVFTPWTSPGEGFHPILPFMDIHEGFVGNWPLSRIQGIILGSFGPRSVPCFVLGVWGELSRVFAQSIPCRIPGLCPHPWSWQCLWNALGCGQGVEQVEPGEPWRLSELSCPCQLGLVRDPQASGAQSFTPSFPQKIASCCRGLAWLVLDASCGKEGKSEKIFEEFL